MAKKIIIEITQAQAKRLISAHTKVGNLLMNEHAEETDFVDACETIVPNLHDFCNPLLMQARKQLKKS